MGKYLLEITRENRAERPSEEVIKGDATAMRRQRPGQITQPTSADNYFVLDGESMEWEVFSVISTMNFNPRKFGNGDGWRVLEYPHSTKWTEATSLRTSQIIDISGNPITIYADAQVQVMSGGPTNGVTRVFSGSGAYDEATTFITTLQPSWGYVFIDEHQNNTQVINSRPSLRKRAGIQHRGASNNRNRNDNDRF